MGKSRDGEIVRGKKANGMLTEHDRSKAEMTVVE